LRALREMLHMALTREGHSVECVSDGRVAWERLVLDYATFDLVITDHHMPEMDGLELIKRLRTLPYRGKIIVFSSELRPAVADAYYALKVNAVLPKPVPPLQLRQLLVEFFGPPVPVPEAGSP
jgi:two-component system, chemotaxis family, chemotaxis protein CheY